MQRAAGGIGLGLDSRAGSQGSVFWGGGGQADGGQQFFQQCHGGFLGSGWGKAGAGGGHQIDGLHASNGGVIGKGAHQDARDLAAAPGVLKNGREVAVFACRHQCARTLGQLGLGKQAPAFYPAQAVHPARRRGDLAVHFLVQGLVLVVDDGRLLRIESGHNARSDVGIDAPGWHIHFAAIGWGEVLRGGQLQQHPASARINRCCGKCACCNCNAGDCGWGGVLRHAAMVAAGGV